MSDETTYLTTKKLESEYFVIKKTKVIFFLGGAVGTGIALLFAMYQISEASLTTALENAEIQKKIDAINTAKLVAENSALQLKNLYSDWKAKPPKVNGLIVRGNIEIVDPESDVSRIKLDNSGRITLFAADGKQHRLGLEGKEEGGWIRVFNQDGDGFGRFFANGKNYTFNVLSEGADRGLRMHMDGASGNVTTFRVHSDYTDRDILDLSRKLQKLLDEKKNP